MRRCAGRYVAETLRAGFAATSARSRHLAAIWRDMRVNGMGLAGGAPATTASLLRLRMGILLGVSAHARAYAHWRAAPLKTTSGGGAARAVRMRVHRLVGAGVRACADR
jgi:hypothetical protein